MTEAERAAITVRLAAVLLATEDATGTQDQAAYEQLVLHYFEGRICPPGLLAFLTAAPRDIDALLREIDQLRGLVQRMNKYTMHIGDCWGRHGLRCECGVEAVEADAQRILDGV